MSLRDHIASLKGRVETIGEDGRFDVRLDNGLLISSRLDRDMRRWNVQVHVGDRVTVEYPERSPERASIVFRHLES